MATSFDAWLRALTASGRRIPDGRITIDRGLPFFWGFTLGGDWTGATLACSLRLEPDTPGSTLFDFTCATLPFDPTPTSEFPDGCTPFTISATAVQTANPANLPSDDDDDGIAQAAIDFVLTPSGGSPWRLMGGLATVAGKVTDA